MADIEVSPADAQAALDRAGPGDTVVLGAGTYTAPLRMVDRAGTPGRPIVVQARPGAVLTGHMAAEDFRLEANRRARAVHDGQVPGYEAGSYPGLYPWILDGCRGPHYVFHNSFSSRSDYARKGIWPRLTHLGNALRLAAPGDPAFDGPSAFFGDLAAPPAAVDLRFTTDWAGHAITMRDDVVRYPGWPDDLRRAGYLLGPTTAGDPGFRAPFTGDLGLQPGSPCLGRAPELSIELPDGSPAWTRPPGGDVGAWQGAGLFQGPAYRPLTMPVA